MPVESCRSSILPQSERLFVGFVGNRRRIDQLNGFSHDLQRYAGSFSGIRLGSAATVVRSPLPRLGHRTIGLDPLL